MNNRDVEQMSWDELPRLVSLISQHQTVENVYEAEHAPTEGQKLLQDALVKLYAGILDYQIEVVIFAGSKMEKFKTMFKDAAKHAVKQTWETVETRNRRVMEPLNIVDRETSTGQFKQLSASLDEVRATLGYLDLLATQSSLETENVSIYVDEDRQEKILTWLSPYLHENSHRKTKKTASEGTGTWLLDAPKFQEWISSTLPSVIWLNGSMRSGKSCLAHLVVEHVRDIVKQASNQRLAFFYCDGTDQQASAAMSDSDKIMRSLLKQLTLHDGAIHKAIFDAYERLHNRAGLTADEGVDLMVEMSSQSQAVVIVLDGFDESSVEVHRDVAICLQNLRRRVIGNTRVLITGRPSVEPRLKDWINAQINVRDNNLQDISRVIRKKVLAAANSHEFKPLYWSRADCRAEHVVSILYKHAQGMFRWIESALSYLHKSKYYGAITRRLQSLPDLEDLMDLYAEIWDKAIAAADEKYRKAMKTLILFSTYGIERPTMKFFDQKWDTLAPGLAHVAYGADFAMDPTAPQRGRLFHKFTGPRASVPRLCRV